MRKGDSKLFRNKQVLCDMLTLRTYNWSFTSLALLFGCDRTSIEDQCKKYGAIPGGEVYTIERIVRDVIKPMTDTIWEVRNGELVNKGRSYADYLKR